MLISVSKKEGVGSGRRRRGKMGREGEREKR